MAHSIDFMKTGCTSKISQISEFQNHLPKKIYHSYFYLSELIQKNQFAMTDPVPVMKNHLKNSGGSSHGIGRCGRFYPETSISILSLIFIFPQGSYRQSLFHSELTFLVVFSIAFVLTCISVIVHYLNRVSIKEVCNVCFKKIWTNHSSDTVL